MPNGNKGAFYGEDQEARLEWTGITPKRAELSRLKKHEFDRLRTRGVKKRSIVTK